MALGDQVVVLDKGHIMQVGTPFDVYARPANAFVANFIGSANLYDVDIQTAKNGCLRVHFGFGGISIPEQEFHKRWPEVKPGRIRLLCRPQDVEIVDRDRAHAEVKVKGLLFLGDRIRINGETRTGERLLFETHYTARVRDGDSVPICIDTENIHFIPYE